MANDHKVGSGYIDLRPEWDRKALRALRGELDNALKGTGTANVRVQVDRSALASLKKELGASGGRIKSKVDVDSSSVKKTAKEIEALSKSIEDIGKDVRKLPNWSRALQTQKARAEVKDLGKDVKELVGFSLSLQKQKANAHAASMRQIAAEKKAQAGIPTRGGRVDATRVVSIDISLAMQRAKAEAARGGAQAGGVFGKSFSDNAEKRLSLARFIRKTARSLRDWSLVFKFTGVAALGLVGIQGAIQGISAAAAVAGGTTTAFLASVPALAGAAGVALFSLKTLFSGIGPQMGKAFEMSMLSARELKNFLAEIDGLNLGPNTERFMLQTLPKLGENFRILRNHVQESVFGNQGLIDAVNQLGPFLLQLKSDFAGVAGAVAEFSRIGMVTLFSPEVVASIKEISSGLKDFILTASPGLVPLITGFAKLAGQAGQFGELLGGKVAEGLARIGVWMATTDLAGAWARAMPFLNDFWTITKNVGATLKSIFVLTAPEGAGLLDTIVKATTRMREFTSSASGMQTISGILDRLHLASTNFFSGLGKALPDLSIVMNEVLKVLPQFMTTITDVIGVYASIASTYAPLILTIFKVILETLSLLAPVLEKHAALIGGIAVAYAGMRLAARAADAVRSFTGNLTAQASAAKTVSSTLGPMGREVTVLGAASAKATGPVNTLKTSMVNLGTGIKTGAMGAARGFSAFMGGPWGIAIAAATILIGTFIAKHQEMSAEIKTQQALMAQAGDAYRDNSASFGTWVEETAKGNPEFAKLASSVRASGISMGNFGQAMAGNVGHFQVMYDDLDRQKVQLEEGRSRWAEFWDGTGDKAQKVDAALAKNESLRKSLEAQEQAIKDAEDARRLYNTAVGITSTAEADADLRTRTLASAMKILSDNTQTSTEKANALRGVMDLVSASMLDADAAADNYTRTQKTFVQGMLDGAGAIKGNSDAALTNRDNLRLLASQALENISRDKESGLAMDEVIRKHGERKTAVELELEKQGLLTADTQKLIDKYFEIPKDIKTQLELAGYTDAMGKLGMLSQYQQLLAQGISVDVARDVTTSDSRFSAGRTQGRSGGGFVSGPGGPTADKIPAMLSDGEYVIKASAVKKMGISQLDAINKYATGGLVSLGNSAISKGYAEGGLVVPIRIDLSAVQIPQIDLTGLAAAASAIQRVLVAVNTFTGQATSAVGRLLPSVAASVSGVISQFTRLKTAYTGDALPALTKANLDLSASFKKMEVTLSATFGLMKSKFTAVRTHMVAVAGGISTGVTLHFGSMVYNVSDKMNALIGLINHAVTQVNKLLPQRKLPTLGKVSTSGFGKRRRRGGAVYGGPPGVDTVPAIGPGGAPFRLDNGEHVFTREEVKKMGGQQGVYNFRNSLKSQPSGIKMASGGAIDGIVQIAKRIDSTAYQGSSFRPGGTSWHASGRAVDFPGFNRDKLAQGFAAFGKNLLELIHFSKSGSYQIKNGKPYNFGSAVKAGHFNHVHVAMQPQVAAGILSGSIKPGDPSVALGGGVIDNPHAAAATKELTKQYPALALGTLKQVQDSRSPKRYAGGWVGDVNNKGSKAFSGVAPLDIERAPLFDIFRSDNVRDGMLAQINKWYPPTVVPGGGDGGQAGPTGAVGDTGLMKIAFDTAKSMGANAKVMLALFEAGWVESNWRNLGHQGARNDHDSLGFLQQRPSMGWPNPTNPAIATKSFVSRAMARESRFSNAGALAQSVQVSAFPLRYNQRRGDAIASLKKFQPGFDAKGWARGGAVGGYAAGTQGAAPGLAWVGERGKELVDFNGGETVYNASQSKQIARGAGYARGTAGKSRDFAFQMLKIRPVWDNVIKAGKTLMKAFNSKGWQGLIGQVKLGIEAKRKTELLRQRVPAIIEKAGSHVSLGNALGEDNQEMVRTTFGMGNNIGGNMGWKNAATALSPADLIKSLAMKQKEARDFVGVVVNATKKGLIGGGLDELIAAGPGSALASIISRASTGDIAQMNKLLWSVGSSAGGGMVGGLNSQVRALQTAADGYANAIVSAVKKKLKIKSPSKVMFGLGESTGQGYINGYEHTMKQLSPAVDRLTGGHLARTGTATANDRPIQVGVAVDGMRQLAEVTVHDYMGEVSLYSEMGDG